MDIREDTRIRAGSKWRDEIRAAVERANVAVLIVSADFLASDFVRMNELPPSEGSRGIGCCLKQGAFEFHPRARRKIALSTPKESLIFFFIRLLERLRALGNAPAADLMDYGRSLASFSNPRI